MEIDDIASEIGRPFTKPLAIIQVMFIIAIAASPFIWIWYSYQMAWKTGLTGIFGLIIFAAIRSIVHKSLSRIIKDELKKIKDGKPVTKYSFRERLEKLAKESVKEPKDFNINPGAEK